MAGIFGGLGTIALLIFALIAILAPVWLYFINVYTGGSRDELKKIRELLEQIVDSQPVVKQPAPKDPTSGQVTCPACGKTIPYPAKYAGQTKPCPGCKEPITLS